MAFTFLCTPFAGRAQDFIPLPQKVVKGEGNFIIRQSTSIVSSEYAFLASYLNDHLGYAAGLTLTVTSKKPESNYISLETDETLQHEEGYVLDVQPDRIVIRAKDRLGIFYAFQTLFQTMPPEVYSGKARPTAAMLAIPVMRVDDYPRFAYRGAMLDVSRNFSDKETVMKYLDWASRHKINKFHWHLTDDNGWRIEIKKYPELTNKGAWRGPGEALPPSYGSGDKRYGGFYTQEDIREVVRYALVRNIEIIPEIELPGHSQAVTAAYPETFCISDLSTSGFDGAVRNVWCAGREENFEMIHDILAEIAELFPSEYIHVGGDEVNFSYWRSCPRCQELMRRKGIKSAEALQVYFMKRVEEDLRGMGKKAVVWNDAVKGGNMGKTTMVSGWETVAACENSLKAGYPTVLMPATYMYIDMKQSPLDRGHTWAGMVDTRRLYSFDPGMLKVTDAEAKLIKGVEAALFAELLDRPARFLEYQAYPRLCALAEMGWSDKGARNWDGFYKRLTGSHLDRLAAMGIGFRMFPATVTYQTGKITASSDKKGAEIRYTSDASDPNINSMVYSDPIYDNKPEHYRFRTFYKTGYSTVTIPVSQLGITLKAKERKVINIPLKEHIDKTGIWMLSFTPHESDVMINRLEVTGGDKEYIIVRNGQRVSPFGTLRVYIDEKNMTGTLTVTLTNNNDLDNPVTIGLTPSMYIESPVRISGTLQGTGNFPLTNISDYNFSTYSRTSRECTKGDYVTYTFDEPVECSAIDVRTGMPGLTRYIVTDGFVEYSSDGTTFTGKIALDETGVITLRPNKPVKAVRITVNDNNGEPLAAFQDLRVIPKY